MQGQRAHTHVPIVCRGCTVYACFAKLGSVRYFATSIRISYCFLFDARRVSKFINRLGGTGSVLIAHNDTVSMMERRGGHPVQ